MKKKKLKRYASKLFYFELDGKESINDEYTVEISATNIPLIFLHVANEVFNNGDYDGYQGFNSFMNKKFKPKKFNAQFDSERESFRAYFKTVDDATYWASCAQEEVNEVIYMLIEDGVIENKKDFESWWDYIVRLNPEILETI